MNLELPILIRIGCTSRTVRCSRSTSNIPEMARYEYYIKKGKRFTLCCCNMSKSTDKLNIRTQAEVVILN